MNNTALVIIDVQVAMVDYELPPYHREEMIAVIQDLLVRARATGTPVVYVRHNEDAFEPMKLGQPGWQIHPTVAPLPGEPIIEKQASDSFYHTNLEGTLQTLGVRKLVIAGMQTDMCVDTTCRSAISHGYDVILAADGHSTWDSGDLNAAQIIAHHNAMLPNLAHPDHKVAVLAGGEIEL